jgi:Domain of unknown function DUF11
MAITTRAGCVLLLLVLPGSVAWGQADLRLQATSTGSVVTQTRAQTLTLIVTSNGASSNAPVVVSTVQPIDTTIVAVEFQPECNVSATGAPVAVSFSWQVGLLLSGGSASCGVVVRARPTAPNFQLLLAFSATAVGNVDPQEGNNVAGRILLISANDVLIDLDVSVARSPTGVTPPGSTGTLTATVRNLGRDAAPNIGVITDAFYITGGATELYDIILTPIAATTCAVSADDVGPARQLVLQMGTIPPGGSASCTLGVLVTEFATNPRLFGVAAYYSGYGVWDDNTANNRAVLGFQFFPSMIPTLGPAGLALLAGSLLALWGWWWRERRKVDAVAGLSELR